MAAPNYLRDEIDVDEVYYLAAKILSENEEAPEFDRGVINLLAEIDPIPEMDMSTRMEMVRKDVLSLKTER